MERKEVKKLKQKWLEVGKYKLPSRATIELEVYKKIIRFFQAGEYYYFVFSPPISQIEMLSDSFKKMMGYDNEGFTIEQFIEIIHPDDLANFIDFEYTVVDFKLKLPPEKVMKYKTKYSFRLRKKNGEYLRILQQSTTILCDDDGAVFQNLIVHMDISDLKKDNKMELSFIGLDGEPSFINVTPIRNPNFKRRLLTIREQQIVQLLAEDKTTNEIAQILVISPNTVSTHRKNILRKTETNSVLQLVLWAQEKGVI